MASAYSNWGHPGHSGAAGKGKGKGKGQGQSWGKGLDEHWGSPVPSASTPKLDWLDYGRGLNEHDGSPRSTGVATTPYAGAHGNWQEPRAPQPRQYPRYPETNVLPQPPYPREASAAQYPQPAPDFERNRDYADRDEYMAAHFQTAPAAYSPQGHFPPQWQNQPSPGNSHATQPPMLPQPPMMPQGQMQNYAPPSHTSPHASPHASPHHPQGQPAFTQQPGPQPQYLQQYSPTAHQQHFPPQHGQTMPPQHGQTMPQQGQNMPQHGQQYPPPQQAQNLPPPQHAQSMPQPPQPPQPQGQHFPQHQQQQFQQQAQDFQHQQHQQQYQQPAPDFQHQGQQYQQPAPDFQQQAQQYQQPAPDFQQQGQQYQQPAPDFQQQGQQYQQPVSPPHGQNFPAQHLPQPQPPAPAPAPYAQPLTYAQPAPHLQGPASPGAQPQFQQQYSPQSADGQEAQPYSPQGHELAHAMPAAPLQAMDAQPVQHLESQVHAAAQAHAVQHLVQQQMVQFNTQAPAFAPQAQFAQYTHTLTVCMSPPVTAEPTPSDQDEKAAVESAPSTSAEGPAEGTRVAGSEKPSPETAQSSQTTQVAEESQRTASEDSERSSADTSEQTSCPEMPERPPVAPDLELALQNIAPESLHHVEEFLLMTLRVAERPDELALALYSRAGDSTYSHVVADLMFALSLRLPAFPISTGGVETLVQKVWALCREDLKPIAGELPPETAHGTVLLSAELYVRNLLGMGAVKEVFAALLFCRPHPPDHAVSLSCHLFLRTGPYLDRCDIGSKMVEYLVLRLKEVKGGNLSPVTRQSITDVVDLRNHKWVLCGKGKKEPKKTAGQKKARAAARNRARAFVQRQLEEPETALWPELGPDTDAVTALLELAQSRDPVAEDALALVRVLADEDDVREELRNGMLSSTAENPKARDALLHALGM